MFALVTSISFTVQRPENLLGRHRYIKQPDAAGVLHGQPGVVAVQPAGAMMHLFLDERVTAVEKLAALTPFEYEKVLPTLEDVFVALVRKQELARAA